MSTPWVFEWPGGPRRGVSPAPAALGEKGFRPHDGFQRFLRRGDSVRQNLVFRLQDEYRGASIRQALALVGAGGLFAGALWLGGLSWLATLALCGATAALAVYSMVPGLQRRMVGEQLAELDTAAQAEVWGPPSVLLGVGLSFAALLVAILRLG